MLRRVFGTVLTMGVIGLGGCSAFAENDTKAVPAVLVSSTANNTRLLEQAIASLLEANKIQIGQTAFTQSSLLAIERAPHKDPSGQLIMGRNDEMPQMVQLMIQADVCSIKLPDSDETRALPELKCQAE
ncbi:hypothetical protein L2729_04410 [Shewanella gelidimarina]|uniref:hypothetical protein n=1 Tax=Shewanella gelidimarina TaxID=56813 RepID=UPI00200F72E1|nr:hypothetical protein [Shewanella gelidimarina]MCL1057236.1 hypothetical protein [Shewanella gelidimarina]